MPDTQYLKTTEKSPLYLSIQTGNFNIAQALIKKNFYESVNEVYEDRSLLTACIEARGSKMAETLIDLGADIQHNNFACVTACVGKKLEDFLERVLDKQFDPAMLNLTAHVSFRKDHQNYIHTKAPLLSAAMDADINLRLIGKMLDLGFPINQPDQKLKQSPIFFCNKAESLDFLLQRGADINFKNLEGKTLAESLGEFSIEKRNEFLKIISKYKDVQGAEGAEIFLYAARKHDLSEFNQLIKNKSQLLQVKDINGQTAIQAFARHKHVKLLQILLDKNKIDLLQKGDGNENNLTNLSVILFYANFSQFKKVPGKIASGFLKSILTEENVLKFDLKNSFKSIVHEIIHEQTTTSQTRSFVSPSKSAHSSLYKDGISIYQNIVEDMRDAILEYQKNTVYYWDIMQTIFNIKPDEDVGEKALWLVKEITNKDKKDEIIALYPQGRNTLFNMALELWHRDVLSAGTRYLKNTLENYIMEEFKNNINFEITDNLFKLIKAKELDEADDPEIPIYAEKYFLKQKENLSEKGFKSKVL